MKKKLIIFLALFLSIHLTAKVDFTILNGFKPDPTQLLLPQMFQLDLIAETLENFSNRIKREWTKDQDVANFIDYIDSVVEQSPILTRETFKDRIIKTFQRFDIDIVFTPENTLELINQDRQFDPIERSFHPLDLDKDKEPKGHKASQHLHFKSTSIKPPSRIPVLRRIHGANRTRKEIEASHHHEQESNDAENQAIDKIGRVTPGRFQGNNRPINVVKSGSDALRGHVEEELIKNLIDENEPNAELTAASGGGF